MRRVAFFLCLLFSLGTLALARRVAGVSRRLGGDGRQSRLALETGSHRRDAEGTTVLYAWGLNNDGVFETTPEANPTVTAFYGDEVIATATVAVMKNGQTKATDSITFQTVRCP